MTFSLFQKNGHFGKMLCIAQGIAKSDVSTLTSPLNVNIETTLLISGDKIIKLFVIPVKEVKLVRPPLAKSI
jgi:hypothetical protein